MGELNLLEKTELWVVGVTLEGANLTDMAAAVAGELGLTPNKVMVVDVLDGYITFDLLEREIPQENILGKEERILRALDAIPGVHLSAEAGIHSNGILGLIGAPAEGAEQLIRKVDEMRTEISRQIARRAIVFPTGFELEGRMIEDTNTPYLKEVLEKQGYRVTVGDVIPDSEYVMTEMLSDALSHADHPAGPPRRGGAGGPHSGADAGRGTGKGGHRGGAGGDPAEQVEAVTGLPAPALFYRNR